MSKLKNIVVIGGGTGTYITLYGLKQYPIDLTAIVTMTDSGGSTGKLRDQYGVLPPGDVRQALVALSDSDKIWRELFLYRFENGDFRGHNFGNIFLTVLEKLTNSFEQSISLAETILKTKGKVIPVTLQKAHINAELENGEIIKTEALIDEKIKRPPIKRLFLNKEVKVNPKVKAAIEKADLIIIGPGDLYTSIMPVFAFNKVIQTLKHSSAKKLLILNLMNKLGQTDGFKASDFLKTYEGTLGKNFFDYLLVNNKQIPKKIMEHYLLTGETPVVNDLKNNHKLKVKEHDLLSRHIVLPNKGDLLSRSLVRHDSGKLAKYLWENIISSN